MPCLGSITSSMSEMYRPESLHRAMCAKERLLLVDCRACTEFAKSHIVGAVNVTLPSLMLKRLKKGTLNVSCVIQNNEAKEKYNKCHKTHLLVLYDDCTTDISANPSGVLSLLLKQLKQDGCEVKFLLGGFSTFEERFPEFCATRDDEQAEILGLCNLKITDDSRFSEDKCDGSATPPHLSPFPVRVLANLYLGNARNSADISQLKKYGISYILNVTPNVPNLFQTDSSFKYLQIPISDHWSQNLGTFFPEAIAFIDEARRNNCGVLVHCLAGISRSVTVTVAYLMQREHMSLNQAYDFVKRCKPNISPNFNFMGQLLDFERALGQSEDKCVCEGSIVCTCGGNKDVLLSDSKENSPNYTMEVRPA